MTYAFYRVDDASRRRRRHRSWAIAIALAVWVVIAASCAAESDRLTDPATPSDEIAANEALDQDQASTTAQVVADDENTIKEITLARLAVFAARVDRDELARRVERSAADVVALTDILRRANDVLIDIEQQLSAVGDDRTSERTRLEHELETRRAEAAEIAADLDTAKQALEGQEARLRQALEEEADAERSLRDTEPPGPAGAGGDGRDTEDSSPGTSTADDPRGKLCDTSVSPTSTTVAGSGSTHRPICDTTSLSALETPVGGSGSSPIECGPPAPAPGNPNRDRVLSAFGVATREPFLMIGLVEELSWRRVGVWRWTRPGERRRSHRRVVEHAVRTPER